MPRKSLSDASPEPEIVVARIAGVFGLRGELKCDPTSAGRVAFTEGAQLRCRRAGGTSAISIAGVRSHKGRLLVRIEGVDNADAAAEYAGALLYAPRDHIALEEGEYLDADLAGCAVLGTDGRNYGTVQAIEHYPGSDMLLVNGRMVPMVAAIVVGIDLARREIVIDPPSGLLD